MQFTGIVASFMWDRPSSWSFQAPQHFHFTKLPMGYIYPFSVLAVPWAVNCRCSDTGCTASALEQGELQDIYKKIGVTYAGGQDGGCEKRNKQTLKIWEAKKDNLKTLLVNNTQREQSQGPQLQWSYCPVLNPCGVSEWLRSSSLPGFARCNDCKHRDGGFEKLLNWGVKIPTGMPLLSVASS